MNHGEFIYAIIYSVFLESTHNTRATNRNNQIDDIVAILFAKDQTQSISMGSGNSQQDENEHALQSLLKFQSHEFLVFGYVRTVIEPLLSDDHPLILLGTPHALLQLIISYYNVGIHAHILLWCGSEEQTSTQYNQIHILNIKNHKKYKLSIYDLDHKLLIPTKNKYFDRLNANYCSISGVKLPGWVLNMPSAKQHLTRFKKYHIAFRFGGKPKLDNAAYLNQCDMIMIDSTKLNAISNRSCIDSYYCQIPTSLHGQYSQYNKYSVSFNNNFLTLCGGIDKDTGRKTDKIKRFDLQTLKWDNDLFITRKMRIARTGMACVYLKDISSAKQSVRSVPLVTIGGKQDDGEISRDVEIYSFIDNESKFLAPLNNQRLNAGAAFLPFKKQIVCVGGQCVNGSSGAREIELYDMDQNVWTKLKRKCMYPHVKKPLVWNDEMNYNILYVAGGSLYNSKRSMLGNMELIDMRDKQWVKLSGKDLISLLELRNSTDIFNDWSCRAGLVL